MNDNILALRQRLGRPLVMGHRGACGYAPENTMASFRLAAELGVDAIELDVHLSKDGQLIVIHDETVDRTTNGQGQVHELTLAELRALDSGSHFGPGFEGERLPTLEEVLLWARERQLPVVIEVKLSQDAEDVAEACVKLVDRLGVAETVAFISFDHFVVRHIKKQRPNWQSGVLFVGRVVDPVGVAGAALANGLLPHFAYLRPDLVAAAHREGLWIGTWCPNSEAELQFAIAMGADMIGTNYPDRLKAMLEAKLAT